MTRALIAIYAAVGIVSFGHCWTRHPIYFAGEPDSVLTTLGSIAVGSVWPLYWSVEAWRLTQ